MGLQNFFFLQSLLPTNENPVFCSKSVFVCLVVRMLLLPTDERRHFATGRFFFVFFFLVFVWSAECFCGNEFKGRHHRRPAAARPWPPPFRAQTAQSGSCRAALRAVRARAPRQARATDRR